MDRDRKPVTFTLKSRGVKRPLTSRENLPPAEQSRKRHMVSRFVDLMKTGTIELATTGEVKELIQTSAVKRIRRMGSPSSQIVGESPSESLLVEIDGSDNDLTKLGHTVALLQRQVQSMQAEILKTKETVTALEHNVQMQRSVNFLAFEVCVRTFTDKLLEAFYIAGGKESVDFSDKAGWLRSGDAVKFCQEPGGRIVELFNMKRKPNLTMLSMMKKLRDVSSSISKGSAHVTTPITVAYALETLTDLKDVDVVHKFFRMCFKMDAKDMINRKVTGTLSPEYFTKFRLGR